MAWFEKVTVVDVRGYQHVVEAGPLSSVKVEQGPNGVCVTKEDVFGFTKETTCVQQTRGIEAGR